MSLPKPYPPTQITYTNWDTVIDALESILGTGAAGPITVNIINEKTSATGVTVDGVLLKDNAVTSPALTAGRVPIVGTGGLLQDDGDLMFATDTLTATKIGAFGLVGKLTADSYEIEGSNFDINGGTVDDITSLTVANSVDIGGYDIRALSGTFDSLTSGRVVFAGANGLLVDDADFTFATDTLTVTKIAETNFTGAATHNERIIMASNDIYINNTYSIQTYNIDDYYFRLKARDNGVGLVEVARAQSAADPYFSFGGSQQVKFYNSGVVDFGSVAVSNVGAAGNDFGATNSLVATTFSGTVTIQGTTPPSLILDNSTTGATANSPRFYLRGNYWNDPNNVEIEAYMQLISTGPYVSWYVDNNAGAASEVMRIVSGYVVTLGNFYINKTGEANLYIDNTTTGANANGGKITLSGNEWSDPTNNETQSTIQLISGDNPYLQIKVDDASFNLQEMLRISGTLPTASRIRFGDKNGAADAGDFSFDPAAGAGMEGFVYDYANGDLYWYGNGGVHYVSQTAGFSFGEGHNIDPLTGKEFMVGDIVTLQIDYVKPNGTPHAVPVSLNKIVDDMLQEKLLKLGLI